MLIIDTHAHIYSPDERRYPPIEKPLRPPSGRGSVEDLHAAAKANGVRAVCAIQTSTFYKFDNRYILDSAKAHPDWIAGVVTLDPDNPESPNLLRRSVREFGVRGMRSIAGANGHLDHPGVRALWSAATDLGIVINILIRDDLAAEAERMVAAYPKLRLVLDHCMYPEVGPRLDTIVGKVLSLARFPNLHAKLTFLPTGSKTGFPCADIQPACLKIIDAFGPQRCIWGSDFPNDLWTPKVSYAEHLRIFTEVLPLKTGARAQILGETARALFFPKSKM